MLRRVKFKRCVASLMLVIVLAGVVPMPPAKASGFEHNETFVDIHDLNVEKVDVELYQQAISGLSKIPIIGEAVDVVTSTVDALKSSALSSPIRVLTGWFSAGISSAVSLDVPGDAADKPFDWQNAYTLLAPNTASEYFYNEYGSANMCPEVFATHALLLDTGTGIGKPANLPARMLYFASLIAEDRNDLGTLQSDTTYQYLYFSTQAAYGDNVKSSNVKTFVSYYTRAAGIEDLEDLKGLSNHDTWDNGYAHTDTELLAITPDFILDDSAISEIKGADTALLMCVAEYINYCEALQEMPAGPVRQYTANSLMLMDRMFGETLPYISIMSKHYSVQAYATSTSVTFEDIAAVLFGSTGQYSNGASEFQADSQSPLCDFYMINGSKSFTGIDRVEVLKGDLTNKYNQEQLDSWLAEAQDKGNREQDPEAAAESLRQELNSSLSSNISGTRTPDAIIAAGDYGIVDAGGECTATSTKSVTIAPGIIQGMAFSASYIPMQTNVYSADTIDSWRTYESGKYKEFFFKYGFLRKALYIDTSSAAAVNYYNSGDKVTGGSRLCTLRDLIESDGNDVVLYVDTGYYNADKI